MFYCQEFTYLCERMTSNVRRYFIAFVLRSGLNVKLTWFHSGWIGMVLAAVLVVCCCPVLCCVGIAASAAGLSLKSAAAADGTTGDSAENNVSPKDAKDEEEMVGMTLSS